MTHRRRTPRERLEPDPPAFPYARPARDHSKVRDPDDLEDPPEAGLELEVRKRTVPAGLNGNSLARPGRPPGATDKIPRSIKAAISEALAMHEGGAPGYFFRLSNNHPHLFVTLVRRMLPLQLRAEIDGDSLLGKLMQTAAAARSARDGTNGEVVDVTPTRTWRSNGDATR